MTLYTFWSGDTTYITKYKSIKKAQMVGKENLKLYLEACEYLGEEPETDDESYFIPEEVTKEPKYFIQNMVNTDRDVVVLEEETQEYING